MSNDFLEPWQKMMSEWQKTQSAMTQQMVDNLEVWNRSFTQTDHSYYSNNPLLDIYQLFVQKLFNDNPQFNLQESDNWHEVLSIFPGSDHLIEQMNELIKSSQYIMDQFKEDFANNLPDDETKDYFINALNDISNPYSWLKFSSTDIDEGIKRFSEGTLFSGVSDIDNRIAKAMDSWLELGERNNDYYEILFKHWLKAYEDFLSSLENINTEEKSAISPRRLVELWSDIANNELMSMHRSEEFLAAQKELLHASTEYRLNEQEIAELVCEAMHIPTRREVDDLHKTVTELRREIRQLKQEIVDKNKEVKPSTKKTSRRKSSKSTSKTGD